MSEIEVIDMAYAGVVFRVETPSLLVEPNQHHEAPQENALRIVNANHEQQDWNDENFAPQAQLDNIVA